jgi:hypothetical protein
MMMVVVVVVVMILPLVIHRYPGLQRSVKRTRHDLISPLPWPGVTVMAVSFLNRGNHEDAGICCVFGFMKECLGAYDEVTFRSVIISIISPVMIMLCSYRVDD